MVHRTHGGALPSRDRALEDRRLREKEKLHRQEKFRIADSAASMVKEGQVIILDSGTTTTAIARNRARPAQLSESDHHHQRRQHRRRTGGNCRRSSSHWGDSAQEFVFAGRPHRRRNPARPECRSFVFLGVDGFDVHYGLSTPSLLEAKVNRVMVEVAKHTVAVCDSSKFGRRSLSLIVPTSALQEVITDCGAPKSDLRVLKQASIEVTPV
jgi:DeoR family transcriptional regulator of aga operon